MAARGKKSLRFLPTALIMVTALCVSAGRPFHLPVIVAVEKEREVPAGKTAEALYGRYQEYVAKGDLNTALDTLRQVLDHVTRKHGEGSPESAPYYSELGSLCGRMGLYAASLDYHSSALKIRLEKPGESHPDTAASYSNVGLARYHLAEYAAAVENYNRALEIYRRAPPDNPMAVAVVSFNRGRALDAFGDGKGAAAAIGEAIAITEKTDPKNTGFLGLCYNGLGSALRTMGKYGAAAEQYMKTVELLRGDGEAAQTIAEADAGLGFALYHLGEYSRALEHYERARSYYAGAYGADHLYSASVYQPMGDTLRAMGEYTRAAELYNRTLEIYRRAYGDAHQHTAGVYINLGEVYRALGDTGRAVEYHTMALGVYQKTLSEKHVHTGTALVYLGGAYKSQGNYAAAIEAYGQAAAIYRELLGAHHSYLGTVYTNLGGAYEPAGDYARALEFYQRALPIYLKSLGERHPHTATLYNNLGLAYFRTGEYASSMEHYRRALDIYKGTLGEHHPHAGIAYTNTGLAAARLGNHTAAMDSYRRAEKIFEKNHYRAERIILKENMARLCRSAGDIDGAAGHYRAAIDLIMKYRLELGRQKTGFMARHFSVFNGLLEIERERKRPGEAFRIDGMRRGLSITEGLSLRGALAGAGVPDNEKKRLLDADAAIEGLQSRHAVLLSEKNPAADGVLRELWKAEGDREAIIDGLAKRSPAFGALVKPKIPSAEEITGSLERDEVLISYSLDGSRCTLFALDRENGLKMYTAGHGGDGEARARDEEVRNLYTLCKRAINSKGYRRVRTAGGGFLLLDDRDEDPRIVTDGGKIYRITEKDDTARAMGLLGAGGGPRPVLLGSADGVMAANDARAYRKLLKKKLYRDFLLPVLGQSAAAKRIIIVPDGVLYYLPFGLLEDDRGSILLERHSVTMVHSPSVWHGLARSRTGGWRHPLLAVGNAVYDKGHGVTAAPGAERRVRSSGMVPGVPGGGSKTAEEELKRQRFVNLPGTGEEVRAVMAMAYKDPQERRSHSLEGVEANEDALVRLGGSDALRRYRVLHFAVHGLLVDDAPALNALVFTLPPWPPG
ncbi:MAG TPA: tetratricopeptide repeat protein [Spirochaetes bacterium]|nr:tetratricopeptide repeat protein [Spirochaetota bacterium]